MSLDSSQWVLPAVTAVAMAAVLWTMYGSQRRAPDFYDAAPSLQPSPPAATDDRAKGKRVTIELLDDVLEDVRDVAIPVQKTVGALDPVPFTEAETRHIVTNILSRVNDTAGRGTRWDLRLVAIDSVLKAVDPYKTLYYTLTFMAYSPHRNVAYKLVADVVVPVSNDMYVEKVRQFSTSGGDEDGRPRGSRGPHTEATHSKWTPLVDPLTIVDDAATA